MFSVKALGLRDTTTITMTVAAAAIGLAWLAPRAHAQGQDDARGSAPRSPDVEDVAEAYSDGSGNLRSGPLHSRLRVEEIRGRLEEAARAGDDVAKVHLAVFEAKTGRPDHAVSLLEEVLDVGAVHSLSGVSAVSSLQGLAAYDLGLVHLRNNRPDKARGWLAEAAAISSDRPEPSYALALTCERLGKTRETIAAYDAAAAVATPSLAAVCALRSGKLHEHLGELEEALASYRKPRRFEAGNPTPGQKDTLHAGPRALHAGRVLLQLGRPAEATVELERALAWGEDPNTRFLHGVALALSGKATDLDVDLLKDTPELAKRLSELAAARLPMSGGPR
jgi:tetratricopeptide (TPR) repeat protein